MVAPAAPHPAANLRPETRTPSTASAFLQSRISVLAVLFLVTGALGIPLLWINRNFSPTERIAWTIIVMIYTISLVAFTGWIVWWAYSRIVG